MLVYCYQILLSPKSKYLPVKLKKFFTKQTFDTFLSIFLKWNIFLVKYDWLYEHCRVIIINFNVLVGSQQSKTNLVQTEEREMASDFCGLFYPSTLNGYSQLMHMHIRYHIFSADLHIIRNTHETESEKCIWNI